MHEDGDAVLGPLRFMHQIDRLPHMSMSIEGKT